MMGNQNLLGSGRQEKRLTDERDQRRKTEGEESEHPKARQIRGGIPSKIMTMRRGWEEVKGRGDAKARRWGDADVLSNTPPKENFHPTHKGRAQSCLKKSLDCTPCCVCRFAYVHVFVETC